MKIALTAAGPDLDTVVDARFGRCPYFLIVEPESLKTEAVKNPNTVSGGGAGIQSAQILADKNVTAVLTGNCGPNAFRTLEAAGIQVITGVSGPIREAVEQYKSGKLTATDAPNVENHFGMGSNR